MAADPKPARIPLLDVADSRAAAERAGLPPVFGSMSVFRALLRHPELAGAVAGLLQLLLRGQHLDARLRELLILRIGWVTGSLYEWTQHWRVARLMQIPEADLLGVRDWKGCAAYGPAERAVLAATDETLETGAISDATFALCREHVGGPEALLELVIAIGNWRMFSSLLRSLEIPLEEGTEPWPPDGRRPAASG